MMEIYIIEKTRKSIAKTVSGFFLKPKKRLTTKFNDSKMSCTI